MKFRNSIFMALLSLAFVCSTSTAANLGAEKHAAKGVNCAVCHGTTNPPIAPETATCIQCHDKKALMEKTSKIKPTNPHTSPHYGDDLDCTNCHKMHSPSENYCSQCHNFEYKVP